ncbi:hypothetical protein [Mesorhizobium sp.]|uniref:hypothetical protein n=1 Tax=Mesorhizobium sp. TaxID=1871066 RepID=UPI000FE3F377|nr:hypothetical protein [Mesorhizobium sp.]RWK39268.1 MAG: hypothetical protein EOR40_04460 [Mesorhizobium sp.]
MLQIVPIEDAEFIARAVNSHHEQEKRIAELEDAIRPFAALALHYPTSRKYGNRPTTGSILHVCSGGIPDAEITVEAIHKAAQLLEGK